MTVKMDVNQALELKKNAKELHDLLISINNERSRVLLDGGLLKIFETISAQDELFFYDEIPHFELMTRDYLPAAEEKFFKFFSCAILPRRYKSP